MGGCCCSSRKPQFHGTPIYFYCPQDSEEQESLTSYDSVSTALTPGLLVDLSMDMSVPDTFRPPPAPLPYDIVMGQPDVESGQVTINGGSLEKANCADPKEVNCRIQTGSFPPSPRKAGIEIWKTNSPNVATNEEDACPTCLEEYDAENPKIATRCNHHFHLSCILEWMERSETCPICDQKMVYKAL